MKMGKSFMPKIRTERELKRTQLEGLQWTVNHVYKNSDFYRKRFDEAGVKPKHIKSLKEPLRALPRNKHHAKGVKDYNWVYLASAPQSAEDYQTFQTTKSPKKNKE